MTPGLIFTLANVVAAAAWLLLATVPRQRWVTGVVTRLIAPGLFAVVYVGIATGTLRGSDGGFSSLDGVGCSKTGGC